MTTRIMLALLLTTAAAGCAPTLEAARQQSIYQAAGVSQVQRDDEHCRRLSRTESTLRYVSVGAAVLGGGSGLATIPVEDGAQTALAITGAGFAVVAGTSEAVRASVASDYVRDCQ